MIMRFWSSLPFFFFFFFFTADLEDLLSNVFIKTQDPEVEQNQTSAADDLAAVVPAGHDLEAQSSLSLWLLRVTDDDWFQGQVLCAVSNCSWRSLRLYRNQSCGVFLQILAWMSALPGARGECALWAVESHPVLSGPVVAPVLGELLQLVSEGTAWFLAEWADSCWQARRQVVCTFLEKALRISEMDIKDLKESCFWSCTEL